MDWEQLRENRRTWDRLAASFDKTRTKPWSVVEEFTQSLSPNSRVLDAGCGNGRHARLVTEREHELVGLDLSGQLLRLARNNVPDAKGWVSGALERLPFRDQSFDAVLALAVLHHVRGHRHRIATLHEIVRLLKPGGRALLSVWSRDQPRFQHNPPRPPADGRPLEPGDAWVQWTQHGHNEPRFMHLFTWIEWHRELDAAQVRIERVWPEAIMTADEPDNFFAVIRRKEPKKNDTNVKGRTSSL